MAEIIDLTVSPGPEIIEISSEQDDTSPTRSNRTQEHKKRKRKKGKTTNGHASDSGIGSSASAQHSRAHSLETGDKHGNVNSSSTPYPEALPQALQPVASSAFDEARIFFVDVVAPPLAVEDAPTLEPTESKGNENKLLLPSHVAILDDDTHIPAEIILPAKLNPGDVGYIEYLDYEDRKVPGLVRYFEVERETDQSRSSIFKCKNCGVEGRHRTHECPTQICLTCGARDEHSTRSCPISKTCYTCGMKGHINKTCPNRFLTHMASSDFHGDCDRCGSTEHKTNECPTLWRIYQYVNDEERILIIQCREEKKQLATGEGGEGYIGREMWCYNCASMGHLGDDCDESRHPAIFLTANSAFSFHNVMSGPFYDPAVEPVSVIRKPRERERGADWLRLPGDWDAGAPPVDVGKRGKNKEKEKLEKRFREQEDDPEDWFNGIRDIKRRGMDRQAPPPGPHEKTLKFRLDGDGGLEPHSLPASLPTKRSGSSLLARLSDRRGGRNPGKSDRDRNQHDHELPRLSENPIRIRGAAAEQREMDGGYASSREIDWEQGHETWDDRDKLGPRGSRRGHHGSRYRGGYSR